MSQSSVADVPAQDCGLKNYSCLICRQRKVKCDRRNPCSNCLKAEKHCSFIPPVRGKRKRTKPRREGLHARLKRYEDLLKSYGANVEPSEELDDSESETASQPDVEMEDAESRSESRVSLFGLEEAKPKLITKEGTSRYFESALWSNLGDEHQHPEVDAVEQPMNVQESEMFFEPEPSNKLEHLASLHPSPQILARLKEVYADRVDPMMKILHLPTFWAALSDGLQHPQEMSKSFEAEIFAFYLAAINALTEDECQKLFGIQKSLMYSRYRLAARQALVNAGFLSTSNVMTLRAYAIFLMCVKNSYRCDALYVMSGISIRLARKMGLHRDGSYLQLPVFDVEMRRRLWWHIVHIDFRAADVLGARPSLDLSFTDTKKPLNVNDEDLHPDMVEPPEEREGITSIALCLMRCEIMDTLTKFAKGRPGDVRWEALYSPDITVAKKESIITQIEDHWEKRYLRYCDPSNSFHTFLSFSIRSSMCKMRILARSPRQYASRSTKAPQSDRDIVFANAIKLLEYVALVRAGSHGLDKYSWQLGTSYLWNTMLHVLIEARHRKIGPEVDRSWQLIGAVFSNCPQMFEDSTGPVYRALGKWTLDVWEVYVEASKAAGLPEPPTPDYIAAIRHCRKPTTESVWKTKDSVTDFRPATRNSSGYNKTQSQRYEENLTGLEPFESYDFPNLMSFEMDPNEWVQWDQLLAEQGGFVQVDSI
ncbi:C6 transcription factor [Hypoxylon sp. FL1857]|nr:C6 transcription factor [Hypoxylon sp. FL1857]